MVKVVVGNNVKRETVIVDSSTTLRTVLEDAGIDYTRGVMHLDGSSLNPGDLDKTFADFGVTEKCYLLNVVKSDNAAAIKIVGGVAVIESGIDLKTLQKVSKYRPNALCLFEGSGKDKEAVFAVGTTRGTGSISKYGASFGSATTVEGKATITMMIPEGAGDPKQWVMEQVGTAILNLNKVEAQVEPAIAEIDGELEAIEGNITVM